MSKVGIKERRRPSLLSLPFCRPSMSEIAFNNAFGSFTHILLSINKKTVLGSSIIGWIIAAFETYASTHGQSMQSGCLTAADNGMMVKQEWVSTNKLLFVVEFTSKHKHSAILILDTFFCQISNDRLQNDNNNYCSHQQPQQQQGLGGDQQHQQMMYNQQMHHGYYHPQHQQQQHHHQHPNGNLSTHHSFFSNVTFISNFVIHHFPPQFQDAHFQPWSLNSNSSNTQWCHISSSWCPDLPSPCLIRPNSSSPSSPSPIVSQPTRSPMEMRVSFVTVTPSQDGIFLSLQSD